MSVWCIAVMSMWAGALPTARSITLSAADQTKLFQEFQQADNAITRKKGGTQRVCRVVAQKAQQRECAARQTRAVHRMR
jgi:hypothetical protein